MELTSYIWFNNPGLVAVCFLLALITGILGARKPKVGLLVLGVILLIPFILDVSYFLSDSNQADGLGTLTTLFAIPITVGRLVIALLLFSAGTRLGRAGLSVSLIAMTLAVLFLFAGAGYLLSKSYQQGYFAGWKNIGHPAEIETISHLGDTDLEVITTDGRVFEADFLYSCGGQIGNEPTRNACWYALPKPRKFEPAPSPPCWIELSEPRIPENATLVQHSVTCYSADQTAVSTWAVVLDGDVWVWWVRRDKIISQLAMLTGIVFSSALGLQIGSALSTILPWLRFGRR